MSIRLKLTIAFIVVILLGNAISSLVTVLYIGNVLLEEVQTRVRLDLNSARDVYNNQIKDITQFLQAVSVRRSIASPLTEEVRGDLGKVLQSLRQEGKLDMLTLIGLDGRVIYRTHNPQESSDNLSSIPIVAKVLDQWKPASGTVIRFCLYVKAARYWECCTGPSS